MEQSSGMPFDLAVHGRKLKQRTQKQLPEGVTVLPVILATDKTHLTTYSGDKAMHPVYLSIGNIRGEIRNKTNRRAWVMVAMLPVFSISSPSTQVKPRQSNAWPSERTDLPSVHAHSFGAAANRSSEG